MGGAGVRPAPPVTRETSLADVSLHGHLAHFGSVDDAARIDGDPFRRTGAGSQQIRIGDEVLHLAVLRAADADPALPSAWMRRVVARARLGVSNVQVVVLVDEHATRAA